LTAVADIIIGFILIFVKHYFLSKFAKKLASFWGSRIKSYFSNLMAISKSYSFSFDTLTIKGYGLKKEH